jgi:hypothetical protein
MKDDAGGQEFYNTCMLATDNSERRVHDVVLNYKMTGVRMHRASYFKINGFSESFEDKLSVRTDVSGQR